VIDHARAQSDTAQISRFRKRMPPRALRHSPGEASEVTVNTHVYLPTSPPLWRCISARTRLVFRSGEAYPCVAKQRIGFSQHLGDRRPVSADDRNLVIDCRDRISVHPESEPHQRIRLIGQRKVEPQCVVIVGPVPRIFPADRRREGGLRVQIGSTRTLRRRVLPTQRHTEPGGHRQHQPPREAGFRSKSKEFTS
jgi:hypothetical protein